MPLLFTFVGPMVVASLLYCKLAGRSGVGRKWMVVSCIVLAACAAMQTLQGRNFFEFYDTNGQHHVCTGLWACVGLAQFLVPLGIGWWFMRRKREHGQLQLAS
jgi:hypothetical protein